MNHDPDEPTEEIETVAPPPPAKPSKASSRKAAFTSVGLARDPKEARKRILAARRSRARTKRMFKLNVGMPVAHAEALQMIAIRFDVTNAAVARKALIDGILKYGSEQEIKHAGLGKDSKEPNPFDPMEKTIYDEYRAAASPMARQYLEETRTRPNLEEILKNAPLAAMPSGISGDLN